MRLIPISEEFKVAAGIHNGGKEANENAAEAYFVPTFQIPL